MGPSTGQSIDRVSFGFHGNLTLSGFYRFLSHDILIVTSHLFGQTVYILGTIFWRATFSDSLRDWSIARLVVLHPARLQVALYSLKHRCFIRLFFPSPCLLSPWLIRGNTTYFFVAFQRSPALIYCAYLVTAQCFVFWL